MSTNQSTTDLETLAVAALRALSNEVSVVKLREITREPEGRGKEKNLLAHVDVLGRSHTLACEISSSAKPERLRSALRGRAPQDGAAMRVIIAPYLSQEAQAVCKEHHAGFIDLEGNARIALGEIFIGKRSLGPRTVHPPAALPAKPVEPLVARHFPSAQTAARPADYPPIAIPA